MSSSVTATFVFTDLVGSTALASSVTAGDADQLRLTHFGLLRTAVSASGGTEVKNLGDGLMVVFSSPSRAVSCAVGMQQAVDAYNVRSPLPLSIRVGVATGEATEEDGDYFGTPVIEAARVCAHAEGGQILATDLVRMMIGRNAMQEMLAIGAVELKGLPDPVEVVEVVWEPEEHSGLSSWPLPARLVRGATESLFGFFGRETELVELETFVKRNLTEPRVQLLWVSGEPGIGKTTLVAHGARSAHTAQTSVSFGSCEDGLPVPFGPWITVLRDVAEHAGDEAVAGIPPMHRRALSRLVPELGDGEALGVAGDTEQFMLFDAIGKLLEAVTAERPLLLVLDDLHWADAASLQLLRHLVTKTLPARVLIIATYRDSDVSRGHPLSALIADLHREPAVGRIHLAGLSDHELMELMVAAAGHELEDEGVQLAHALRRETDGNPFFVAEILRHLGETGEIYLDERNRYVLRSSIAELGLPTSVRDVIGRRIERLGEDTVRVLSSAAVIGRDFDVTVLAAVVDLDEDSLLDLLEAAVGAAVLLESTSEPGRFRFAHALTQHTLYKDLGATRRHRLHARIAQIIEDLYGDTDTQVPELAYHWLAATRPSDTERALHYARRAGDLALAALAADDAAHWYQQGLEILERDALDDRARCSLLIALGRAQRLGGNPEHRATLLEAARLARELQDASLLVAAVFAGTRESGQFEADDERAEVIRAALEAIGNDDSTDRARLLCALAAVTSATEWQERYELGHTAIDIARRVADDATLAFVLNSTDSYREPDTVEQRVAHADLAVAVADRVGDPIARFHAWAARRFLAVVNAERGTSTRCLAVMAQIAEAVPLPSLAWPLAMAHSVECLLDGDIAGAEAAADEALAIASNAQEPEALAAYGSVLLDIRRQQGRLFELLDLFRRVAHDYTGLPVLEAVVAFIECEQGNLDEARTIFAPHADSSFEMFPRDQPWSSAMGYCAEIAVALDDRRSAETIRKVLDPYRSLVAATTISTQGAIGRPLGRLASFLGDRSGAASYFEEALEVSGRLGARYWTALTRLDFAELLASGDATERERVHELAAEALDAARTYGYAALEPRAVSFLDSR